MSKTEFDLFYDENALYVLRLACKFVPLSKAEDIVQNVFIEIWKRWDSIDKKPQYLRNAVKYRCFDEIKRISMTPIDGIEIEDVKEVDIKAERLELIKSYLKKLKPTYRSVIECVIYGYSNDEIAQELRISKQTVKNVRRIAVYDLKNMING
jgi:RNA polymerase sigma factor (sigma-70 family)